MAKARSIYFRILSLVFSFLFSSFLYCSHAAELNDLYTPLIEEDRIYSKTEIYYFTVIEEEARDHEDYLSLSLTYTF